MFVPSRLKNKVHCVLQYMCTDVYVLYCVPFYCVFCLFLFCLFFVCLFCCCLFFAIVRHISMLFIDNEDSVFCMMHNYYYVSWDLKGHIFILNVNQLLHKYLLGRRGGRGRSVRFQFETSHERFNFLLVEKNRLKLRRYRPWNTVCRHKASPPMGVFPAYHPQYWMKNNPQSCY